MVSSTSKGSTLLRLGHRIAGSACIILLVALAASLYADEPVHPLLQRYFDSAQQRNSGLRGTSLEVTMDAVIPKLNEQGHVQTLRVVDEAGKVSYDAERFQYTGDNRVKKEVIARYMTGETQDQSVGDVSITPANYKFKLKGTLEMGGHKMQIFQLNPHKKRVGLFKGELWLDDETALPLRESGRFVKNPSIVIKRIEFTREYDIKDGVAVPRTLEWVVDTRLVGKTELKLAFSKWTPVVPPAASPAPSATQ